MADAVADPRYGRGGMAWHALIVMAATVVTRLLGVLRESVIAERFGTGEALAAYRQAFRVPDTIYLVIIGGALGSAFIPVFTAYLARLDDRGAWRLASTVLNLALIVAVIVAGLAFLFAPGLVRWVVAPGFDAAQRALTVRLVRLLLLQPILLGLGGLAMAILNAFRRFLLTSLAPLVYNVSIIAGALFLAPRWGIDGLVVGVLAGAGLYLLAMVPGLALCRMRYSFSLDWREKGVREVGRLLGPRLLGQMAFQLNFIAIGALASFRGSLAVTAIDYAYRLLFLPLGILGVSLGTVVFPTLSVQANEGRMADFHRTLTRMLRVVSFLALPATTLLLALRVPVVQLLFERGQFGDTDTAATAWALLFFVVELAPACLQEIVVRAFYALHDTRTPVVWGVIGLLVNVPLGAGLMQWMGYAGLALSFALVTTAKAAVLLGILLRRVGIAPRELAISGARSLAAAALAGLAAGAGLPLIERLLPGAGLLMQFWRLALMSAVGAGLYLAAAAVFRSPEIREAWAVVRRRLS